MSLKDVVNHCLELESAKATQRGIKIISDISFNLPLIELDELKFKQALLNLCENAIDAMPNGGTLIVRGYTTEKVLCLDIIDNGEGISEEIDAFAPHVTTKGKGMGVGLFIVQRIVSAHGGAIHYTSKKGEGTTFHLAVPIRDGIMNKPFRNDGVLAS